jgi:hypothetical protein
MLASLAWQKRAALLATTSSTVRSSVGEVHYLKNLRSGRLLFLRLAPLAGEPRDLRLTRGS